MSKAYMATALVLLMALLQGCSMVDQQDFMALQNQVAAEQQTDRELARRVEQLSKELNGSRAPEASMLADLDSMRQELERINSRLEETARQGPEQASAMAALTQRLTAVESSLGMASAGARLPAAAGTAASLPSPLPAPVNPSKPVIWYDDGQQPVSQPRAPKAMYESGLRLYEQKFYREACKRFESLLKSHPSDKLAADAQFWVGESYYAQKKYEQAILAYNHLVKSWPQSGKAPAALLKQSMAFKELGDQRTARAIIGILVKRYPSSSAAHTAERLLDNFNKNDEKTSS